MKKNFTFLISTFVMLTLFSDIVAAQEVAKESRNITVIVRSKSADGSENVSTMIKSGDAAKNFDAQKYVEEQKKLNPDAHIVVNETRENGETVNDLRKKHKSYQRTYTFQNYNDKGTKYPSDKGFLGVSEWHTENKLAEGVRVTITRNSGAAKAGLKDDDVILQLNKTPINSFRDISKALSQTKAGEKVEVVFDRDGKTKTVTAVLGEQKNAWEQDNEQEKEACLGVYTSSHLVEAQRGAIVQDFTEKSAAKEANMEKGDLITSVNGIRVKTHQDVWDEIAKYKPKEVVRVAYLHGNEPKEIRATLKACKPREENVIVVPKADVNAPMTPPANLGRLDLETFTASPNPAKDMINVSFKGEAVPTNLGLYDLTGKLLFQQNLSDFNGEYSQRFDVSEFAKGVVVVKVQQGDKVISKQIVVN